MIRDHFVFTENISVLMSKIFLTMCIATHEVINLYLLGEKIRIFFSIGKLQYNPLFKHLKFTCIFLDYFSLEF